VVERWWSGVGEGGLGDGDRIALKEYGAKFDVIAEV
jgi:hypothetical protein